MTDTASPLARVEQLLQAGRYAEVQAACFQALRSDPRNAEAHFYLGVSAWQQGAMPQAATQFQRATELNPDEPKHPMRLAAALLEMGRLEEAAQAADRAAARETSDPLTIDSIGVIYGRLGRFDQAARLARKAVTRDPRNPGFQFNLGWAERYAGDLDAAATAYRRAIELNPGYEGAYLALIEITKQTPEKNFVPVLQRLFQAAAGRPERLSAIGHALAKTYEDMGDEASSMAWLERAKAPQRPASGWSAPRNEALFAAAAATYGGPQDDRAVVDHEAAPIFIIGMPRSGTTLVDRIVSNHPDVVSAGELKTFPVLIRRAVASSSRRLLDAEVLAQAKSLDLAPIGRAYLEQARAVVGPAARFVDKLPFNFFYAGLIRRALPQARFICLRRDPVDTCLSNYRQAFSARSDFHDYVFRLEDVARYYVQFDRLVAHWRSVMPPDCFLEVDYEALVADQEAQTRRLIAFCGLEWDPRCLDFHENTAGVSTASAAQVRKPMYATSVGRWKRYGDLLKPMTTVLEEAGLIERV